MKSSWFSRTLPIAFIFSMRMLGLFMLIPVFTVYAGQLQHATPALTGLALGAYGLSQGLLQIPMGLLSDRYGRKLLITIGLLFFITGSLLGALTDSMYGMIIARLLQGIGAIGSVLIALLADVTQDEDRTKAMAVIGVSIGLSFSIAIILSPGITLHFGLSGIFYFSTLLGILALAILHFSIPIPKKERFHADSVTNLQLLSTVLTNKHLQRLNLGIFCQHFILTSSFFIVPLRLQHYIQQQYITAAWKFYLPLMLFSFLIMLPIMRFAEKKQQIKPVFIAAVSGTSICQLLLFSAGNDWQVFCFLLFIYFIAFNFLEATLPSLVSRQADSNSKGTGMGVYSSCQFLGIFAGGTLAGMTHQTAGIQTVFLVNFIVSLLWLFTTRAMKPNVYQTTLLFPYPAVQTSEAELCATLKNLPGVKQVSVSPEEKTIYLTINKSRYAPGSAERAFKALNTNDSVM